MSRDMSIDLADADFLEKLQPVRNRGDIDERGSSVFEPFTVAIDQEMSPMLDRCILYRAARKPWPLQSCETFPARYESTNACRVSGNLVHGEGDEVSRITPQAQSVR